MSRSGPENQHQAMASVLGVLAIPIVTVSSAALIAGPVASAHPAGLAAPGAATLIGVVAGLMIVRVARMAVHGVHTAAMAAANWIESESATTIIAPQTRFVVIAAAAPVPSPHVRAASRRGPPAGL